MADLKDNRFATAARYNDALAEEWGPAILEALGVVPDEVRPVAYQRALRLRLLLTARDKELRAAYDSGKEQAIPLSDEDNAAIRVLALAVLDGILIGVRAKNART